MIESGKMDSYLETRPNNVSDLAINMESVKRRMMTQKRFLPLAIRSVKNIVPNQVEATNVWVRLPEVGRALQNDPALKPAKIMSPLGRPQSHFTASDNRNEKSGPIRRLRFIPKPKSKKSFRPFFRMQLSSSPSGNTSRRVTSILLHVNERFRSVANYYSTK